jgi:hypothetical protein
MLDQPPAIDGNDEVPVRIERQVADTLKGEANDVRVRARWHDEIVLEHPASPVIDEIDARVYVMSRCVECAPR